MHRPKNGRRNETQGRLKTADRPAALHAFVGSTEAAHARFANGEDYTMDSKTSNWILAGIAAGIAAAFAGVAMFGESMLALEWTGELFLKALRMIIIPLVTASIVSGIAGLGDVRKLGQLGGVTILYYSVTTALAVGMGVILVNIIQPGRGMDLSAMGTPEQVVSREPTGVSDILRVAASIVISAPDSTRRPKRFTGAGCP